VSNRWHAEKQANDDYGKVTGMVTSKASATTGTTSVEIFVKRFTGWGIPI
jgi:hypothetical protein